MEGASRTAIKTAQFRAAHALVDRDPIFEDRFALSPAALRPTKGISWRRTPRTRARTWRACSRATARDFEKVFAESRITTQPGCTMPSCRIRQMNF
jgi:hypothetical protein